MVERIGSISPFSLAVDEGVGICRSSWLSERRCPKTCPVPGRHTPKTCMVEAVCGTRAEPVPQPSRSPQRKTAAQEPRLRSGGGRESNPPASFRPPTGFEDRGAHQAP